MQHLDRTNPQRTKEPLAAAPDPQSWSPIIISFSHPNVKIFGTTANLLLVVRKKGPRGRQSPTTGRGCDCVASAKEIRTGCGRLISKADQKTALKGFIGRQRFTLLYSLSLFASGLAKDCTQSSGASHRRRAASYSTLLVLIRSQSRQRSGEN